MKFWNVVDNGIEILNTTDELKALRELKRLCDQYKITMVWVDEKELDTGN